MIGFIVANSFPRGDSI